MKKIISCVLMCLMFVLSVFIGVPATTSSFAVTINTITDKETFKSVINDVLSDTGVLAIKNRVAGSQGETQAKDYIVSKLGETNFVPKTGAGIENGIQTFKFESEIDGGYQTSQNIIYVYESASGTGKKVIIGSHYDALAYDIDTASETYGSIIETEAVSTSAGNVALMLALAEFLPNLTLSYDIELVFFGAGETNKAGSDFYTDGISEQDSENILCMINLDDVSVGKNTYFYVDEIETDLSKLLTEIITTSKISAEKVKTHNLNKIIDDGDRLGLGYTHLALDSDNVCFMENKILSLNIFAGDYSSGIELGKCEYSGKDSIAYTSNDNLEYISKNFGENVIVDNLYNAYSLVFYTLTDADFVKVCERGVQTGWLYTLFASEKMAVYLTVVALLLLIVAGSFIHYKLSVKAYNSNVEMGFLSTVVKISEQVDQTGKDEDVPKVISQVIAADIKKDKTIKGKKHKDKK